MSDANRTISLTGNLTTDPELRETPNGKKVCKLRLAVDAMGGRDADGNPRAGYIDVSVWGNSGEAAAKHLTRGYLVTVAGLLTISPWENGDRKGLNVSIERADVAFGAPARTREPDEADRIAGEELAGVAAGDSGDADIPF